MKYIALMFALSLMGKAYAEDSLSLDQHTLRAQLTAVKQATLASEMTGKIERLYVREGETVKKGAVLVRFDCGLQKAKLAKASAEAEVAKNTLTGKQRMYELNAIGDVELKNSQLEVKKADAEILYLKEIIQRCTVYAPFGGAVGDQFIKEKEFIEAGKPIMELLAKTDLQVEFIVPSRWLSWLKPGYKFDVIVDDTQKSYPVKLSYTAAKVDALSQSVKAVAAIASTYSELLPGMSGHVQLSPPNENLQAAEEPM